MLFCTLYRFLWCKIDRVMDGGRLRRPPLISYQFYIKKITTNTKKHLKIFNDIWKYAKIYKNPSLSATWTLSFYLRNAFLQQYISLPKKVNYTSSRVHTFVQRIPEIEAKAMFLNCYFLHQAQQSSAPENEEALLFKHARALRRMRSPCGIVKRWK